MLNELLQHRANTLKLRGVISHWDEIKGEGTSWLQQFIAWEEDHRSQRSLDSRLTKARIEPFKALANFDWKWPKNCSRDVVEQWMLLGFIKKASNLIVCGPNGVGKTMIASNIAHHAVIKGHTVLFTTASNMLKELAGIDSDSALRRRIKHYCLPAFLVIDEVGFLSYSNRHADLLFEIISQRYEKKSTCITTNKPFSEWRDIFPNASCVVSIIDRLVHHSEILNIEGDSFRLKEATEKNIERSEKRNKNKKPLKTGENQ